MVERIIEEGDIVDIEFFNISSEVGVEVLRRPSDVGDSWVLKRPDGQIIEVILFQKMIKVERR